MLGLQRRVDLRGVAGKENVALAVAYNLLRSVGRRGSEVNRRNLYV